MGNKVLKILFNVLSGVAIALFVLLMLGSSGAIESRTFKIVVASAELAVAAALVVVMVISGKMNDKKRAAKKKKEEDDAENEN